jgi:hypothetical protein
MANKYETMETLKGNTILDPLEYFSNQNQKLLELDKSGLYDRNNKIDNAFFASKEKELKDMEALLFKIVGDMLNDPGSDKFHWDVKLLVVKKDGWKQR